MTLITKVITSDNKIWNQSEVLSDIAFAMSKGSDLVIDLNLEGPDFRALGLDIIIEKESQRYGYDLGKILLKTANMVENYSKIRVQKIFPKHLMEQSLAYDTETTKSKNLKHFGLFIGRNNPPRLLLGTYLYANHKDKILHTNQFDFSNEFLSANIGIEELLNRYGIKDVTGVADYIRRCPINGIDLKYEKNTDKNHAQSLIHQDKDIFLKNYDNFFVEIVCETYFTGDTFFPTEKTWRPILLKTPFIVQGPVGYLKNLREMGFRTFSEWWSEGYDEDDPGTSWFEIIKIVDDLARKPQEELTKMIDEMQPILEHNRSRFLELCARH